MAVAVGPSLPYFYTMFIDCLTCSLPEYSRNTAVWNNLSAILWQKQVHCYYMMMFAVLGCIGQHDSLNFKNFRSLKQQSLDFSPEYYVLRGEAVHINFKFYSLWIDMTGARIHDDLHHLR